MEHTLLEVDSSASALDGADLSRTPAALDASRARHVGVRFGQGAPDTARNELLAVDVGALPGATRGRLAERIDDAIERELGLRHAGPPGIGAARDPEGALADQLFRARQVGATRLALRLSSLAAIAGVGDALGSEDSATLLFWARATRDLPVSLCLDAADSALSAHVDPIPLRLALDPWRAPSSALRVPGRTAQLPPEAKPCAGHPAVAAAVPIDPPPVVPSATAEAPPAAGLAAPDAEVAGPPTEPARPQAHGGAGAASVSEDGHDAWRTPALALTAARGPQPLAALERLFAASYLPLDTMLQDPTWEHPDARAVAARDDFRDTFSHVYVEAFQAFASTGKRPKMVLDAPDIAARIARQTSARTSQLLLVDGLRYDVGARVKEELTEALAQKAALTHEMILWSALPTTTTCQLETLARGASALADTPTAEREESAIRGRTASAIRRVKIGSRDLYRLDLCDVRVREAGERVLPMIPSIAADVARVIARHAATLAPRTLLLVFGDHGFRLGRDGVVASGGSSPEEVLVPAFAFLIGEAH